MLKLHPVRWMVVLVLALGLTLALAGLAGAQQSDDDGQPFLGILFEPEGESVRVVEVLPGSPAADAGLEAGDVITEIDGEAVSAETVAATVGALAVGDTLTLTVERDGDPSEVEVTLAAQPDDLPAPGRPDNRPGRGDRDDRPHGGPFEGMPFEDMPFGMPFGFGMMMDRGYLGVQVEDQAEGGRIAGVQDDSPASTAGLQEGDIVTAVNGEAVDEERTLRDRLFAYEPDDTVTLTVDRDGETLEIEATLAEPQMGGMMMPFGFGPDGLPEGHPPIDELPQMTPEGQANA